MNIHEIAEKSGASLRLLKKLQGLGVLITSESSNPLAAHIRLGLSKGNPLSVAQCVELLANDSLLFALGKYEEKATSALAELGNVHNELAGAAVVAQIEGAANGEPGAIAELASWMQSAIPPAGSVSHHFLAVRIVLAAKEQFRALILKRIGLAFLNCRNSPAMAGWFTIKRAAKGQALTVYHRPAKIPLDL